MRNNTERRIQNLNQIQSFLWQQCERCVRVRLISETGFCSVWRDVCGDEHHVAGQVQVFYRFSVWVRYTNFKGRIGERWLIYQLLMRGLSKMKWVRGSSNRHRINQSARGIWGMERKGRFQKGAIDTFFWRIEVVSTPMLTPFNGYLTHILLPINVAF